MFWSCPVFSDIGTTTKCSFSNFNNLIVKTIRSFALNFYEVIVDEADQNYIFTENWTGRRLLRTKFFTCIRTEMLLQRTGMGEEFFTLNFLYVSNLYFYRELDRAKNSSH